MGTAYEFQCRACGYSAQVCGGRDSGMDITLFTWVCGDCRALVDVAICHPLEESFPGNLKEDRKLRRCPGEDRTIETWLGSG
jgi:hypothetical protein